MNKIGFKIFRAYQGYADIHTVNEGNWTSRVVDCSNYLRFYDTVDPKRHALFLSFSEQGTYITIVRKYPGREGDHISAWIFIPTEVQISDLDTAALVDDALNTITGNGEIDKVRLNEIYSKQYPTVESFKILPSRDASQPAAKRIVGGQFTLPVLLGKYRYQPEYSQYSAILLDNSYYGNTFPIKDSNVADLSQMPISPTAILYPPTQISHDLKVFTARDNKPFIEPIIVKLNEMVPIRYELNGFVPQTTHIAVSQQQMVLPLPNKDSWEVHIGLETFRIVDRNLKTINEPATITIDGQKLNAEGINLNPRLRNIVKVTISVRGYKTQNFDHDIRNLHRDIQMHRANTEAVYKLVLPNDPNAEVSIRAKGINPHSAKPVLPGYKFVTNGTITHDDTRIGSIIIGFVAGFLLSAILAVGAYFLFLKEEPQQTQHPQQTQPIEPTPVQEVPANTNPVATDTNNTTETTTPQEPQNNEAAGYLNNNSKWNKNEMASLGLGNLWDEMNSYHFPEIINFANEKFGTNKPDKLNAVCDVAQQCIEKGVSTTGNYCSENDYNITIDNYINRLNQAIENKQKQNRATAQSNQEQHKTSNETESGRGNL